MKWLSAYLVELSTSTTTCGRRREAAHYLTDLTYHVCSEERRYFKLCERWWPRSRVGLVGELREICL